MINKCKSKEDKWADFTNWNYEVDSEMSSLGIKMMVRNNDMNKGANA
jgi:hypothetical protein